MLIQNRSSERLTRHRPTVLAMAMVIAAGALLAATPAWSQTAPVANYDEYTTDVDTVLNPAAPGVLTNDTDVESDPLSVSEVNGVPGDVDVEITLASGATLTLNADGSFVYTPFTGFKGIDTFTYVASDGGLSSNTATVTITVTPAAVDDGYQTPEGITLIESAPGVLINDIAAAGGTLSVYEVNGVPGDVGSLITLLPSGASLTLNADGSFTYAPVALYTGVDSFTYRAIDDQTTPRTTNEATVYIAVQPAVPDILALVRPVCVNESNGLLNNCTANDLTFVELGLGTQTDGCVNELDRVEIYLRGVVRNTTAQTRYDVGMWFPTPYSGATGPPPLVPPDIYWGAPIDPEGDGAYTGDCGAVGLMNPELPKVPDTEMDMCYFDTTPLGNPGDLDLDGSEFAVPGEELGHGPWSNDDGGNYDACGDIYDDGTTGGCDADANGDWDDSVVIFDSTLQLDCDDIDGEGFNDGFVNTSVCLTWGNQANQVDDPDCTEAYCNNSLCDVRDELRPGTKSKCRCEEFQLTNVPAPELSLACSLPGDVTELRPGTTVQVSITYDNSCTCTEDPATEERFRCCTASYVQFPIDYDEGNGSVSGISPGTGTYVEDTVNGTIIWTPATPTLTDGFGVVAGGQGATLTFLYHIDDDAIGVVDFVDLKSTWSDSNAIVSGTGIFLVDPRDQITLTSTCSADFDPTWATISNVKAEVRDARTVVSWESSAEVGTVGYNVLRADSGGDHWIQVNQHLLPAIGDGPGGLYQLVDDSAPVEGTVTYKVVEVDAWGRTLEAQPVTVELSEGEGKGPRDRFVIKHRLPSTRMTRAIERSARQTQRSKSPFGPSQKTLRDSQKRANQTVHVKVGVSESGLYRVSAAEIAAAMGERVAKTESRIAQQQLALTTGGQPVAWRAAPDNRGILFYGQAPDNLYDAERIYVVRTGDALMIEEASGDAPQPIDDLGSFPELTFREENPLLRPFNVLEENQEFLFWSVIVAGNSTFGEQQVEFELEDVSVGGPPAQLTATFVGFGPLVNAEGSVLVNDHYVGVLSGRVFSPAQTVFEFDQAFLQSGLNTVTFIGLEGGFLVDRLEVAYDRLLRTSDDELTVRNPRGDAVSIHGFSTSQVEVYDVTNPLRPVLLPSAAASATDGSVRVGFSPTADEGAYLATAMDALRQPSSFGGRAVAKLGGNSAGADYVIITTGDLMSTAQRLADHRHGQGLKTMVVDIEDIFDTFAYGSRDPMAIQVFLAHARDQWTTSPSYVLLAGRGHYDYRDELGYGGNLLPPALAATSRGLVPSDNKLADLDGDGLPDVAIGRLPVLDQQELRAAIDKIIAYEAEATGPWVKKVMLAADNPDKAGDFIDSSDDMAIALPADSEIEKVYLSQPYSAAEVHLRLMAALDEGVGIVNWIGHAGFDLLAHERVLTLNDLPELTATDHPAMVLGLTCLINNFGLPYLAAIGEELALLPDGGAIGVWAASGLSINSQAERLGENFMAALDSDQQQRLGDIIQAAIDEFNGGESGSQLVYEYILLGDPGLLLK